MTVRGRRLEVPVASRQTEGRGPVPRALVRHAGDATTPPGRTTAIELQGPYSALRATERDSGDRPGPGGKEGGTWAVRRLEEEPAAVLERVSARATLSRMDDAFLMLPADRVAQIAGISRQRLEYWEKSGLVRPTHKKVIHAHLTIRLYDLADLTVVAIAAELVRQSGVSLQHVRKTRRRFLEKAREPLRDLRWAVLKNDRSRKRELWVQYPDGSWEGDKAPRGQVPILDQGKAASSATACGAPRPTSTRLRTGTSTRRSSRKALGSRPPITPRSSSTSTCRFRAGASLWTRGSVLQPESTAETGSGAEDRSGVASRRDLGRGRVRV